MTELIISIFSVAFLLLLWFDTNFLYYYTSLFIENAPTEHIEWLQEKEENTNNAFLKFFCKLLTCQICLSFWITLPFCLLVGLKFIFVISFSSLFFYFWIRKLIISSY